jgi:hypothetical protein
MVTPTAGNTWAAPEQSGRKAAHCHISTQCKEQLRTHAHEAIGAAKFYHLRSF